MFMIASVILSAGASARMGTPKANLKIGNTTFINCILTKLHSCATAGIYIVTGYHHRQILYELDRTNPCTILHNTNAEQGQLSSLQLALRNFDQQITGMLVVLVDHPLVLENTYRELLESARVNPQSIIIPVYQQQRGHPVYFGRKFFEALLETPLNLGAREVIKKNSQSVFTLPVSDPGIVQDIDTPADLIKYCGKLTVSPG
jgi:molybdenum cofactor cytidylyltransferase